MDCAKTKKAYLNKTGADYGSVTTAHHSQLTIHHSHSLAKDSAFVMPASDRSPRQGSSDARTEGRKADAYSLQPKPLQPSTLTRLTVVFPKAVENGNRVGGGDFVNDLLALALALDNAGTAHLVEVLRNRTLLTADRLDNIANPAFAVQIEMLQNLQPLRMADQLDDISHLDKKR